MDIIEVKTHVLDHMVKFCPMLVLNKDVPSFPQYLACTLMNLKHILM